MKVLVSVILAIGLFGCATPPLLDYLPTHYGHYASDDGRTVIILSKSENYAFLERDGKITESGFHTRRNDGHIVVRVGDSEADYFWHLVSSREQHLEFVQSSGSNREWPKLMTKK